MKKKNKNKSARDISQAFVRSLANLGKRVVYYLFHMVNEHLGLRLLAVFFAILLWAFVISQDSATRSVTVSGLTVEVLGASQLAGENLAIKQDVFELVEREVSVRLEGVKTTVAELDRSKVRAVVDLTQIYATGKDVTVPVTILGADGLSVTRITPYQSISVDVEQLHTREVPVIVEFTGDLPEGYMRPGEDNFAVSPGTITVSGTSSDVNRISAAYLSVDLSEITTSVNARYDYTLCDEHYNPVQASSLDTSSSSVILSFPVYKTKTVPVQYEGTVVGDVAPGFELVGVSVTPNMITIAGLEGDIENVDRVFTRSISIDGAQKSFTKDVSFIRQTGILWYSTDSVEASVEIKEKNSTIIISSLPLHVVNELEGTETTLTVTEVTCAATGPISYMTTLMRDDVYAYVDLLSAALGSNSVNVRFKVLDPGAPAITFSDVTVTVMIEKAAEEAAEDAS